MDAGLPFQVLVAIAAPSLRLRETLVGREFAPTEDLVLYCAWHDHRTRVLPGSLRVARLSGKSGLQITRKTANVASSIWCSLEKSSIELKIELTRSPAS